MEVQSSAQLAEASERVSEHVEALQQVRVKGDRYSEHLQGSPVRSTRTKPVSTLIDEQPEYRCCRSPHPTLISPSHLSQPSLHSPPSQQSDGQLDLREAYLTQVKEGVSLKLRLDQELRRSAGLAADLDLYRKAAGSATEEAGQHQAWLERCEAKAGLELVIGSEHSSPSANFMTVSVIVTPTAFD